MQNCSHQAHQLHLPFPEFTFLDSSTTVDLKPSRLLTSIMPCSPEFLFTSLVHSSRCPLLTAFLLVSRGHNSLELCPRFSSHSLCFSPNDSMCFYGFKHYLENNKCHSYMLSLDLYSDHKNRWILLPNRHLRFHVPNITCAEINF